MDEEFGSFVVTDPDLVDEGIDLSMSKYDIQERIDDLDTESDGYKLNLSPIFYVQLFLTVLSLLDDIFFR